MTASYWIGMTCFVIAFIALIGLVVVLFVPYSVSLSYLPSALVGVGTILSVIVLGIALTAKD
ncbi:MAG: hypothetical protein ACYCQJ_07120 [Nitrososphaerales archaeon]